MNIASVIPGQNYWDDIRQDAMKNTQQETGAHEEAAAAAATERDAVAVALDRARKLRMQKQGDADTETETTTSGKVATKLENVGPNTYEKIRHNATSSYLAQAINHDGAAEYAAPAINKRA